MTLTVQQFPCLSDNYAFLIHDAESGDTAVIDVPEAAPILAALRQRGWTLSQILLTHHHADHTGGVAEIVAWVQQIRPACDMRVYGPAAESIPGVNHALVGGERISLLRGLSSHVLSVAGHTRGHLAYFFDEVSGCRPPALFSGDLIFGLGCGRLFEGTADQMHAALGKVASMDSATRIYCAHEYTALNLPFALKVDPTNADLVQRAERIRALRLADESTLPLLLAEELATNPFLRADQPMLKEAVCLADDAASNDVFAALRKMRDHFKST
jgi:hydroxyacylglutathione hydrolase